MRQNAANVMVTLTQNIKILNKDMAHIGDS